MSHYSTRSRTRLQTTDQELQLLFSEVDPRYAHTILPDGGQRTKDRQRELVDKGFSHTMDSKHCRDPSEAIDAAPDPLTYPDADKLITKIGAVLSKVNREERGQLNALIVRHVKEVARWYHFGGYVEGTAAQLRRNGEMSRRIRWLGDQDGDHQFTDQKWDDLAHFELR